MSTEPCGHCGDLAPQALLRTVQLRVDRAEVDKQTLCPDCFSDWIARYQEEMAENMPGSNEPETTGDDIRIAEEDETVRRHQIGDSSEDRLRDAVGGSGDDIRDLGMGPTSESGDSSTSSDSSNSSDSVDVDLDGTASVPGDDDAEAENEDDDTLF